MKPNTPIFTWVCIYKYDEEPATDGLVFDDFYLATEYLVSQDFAIVHISSNIALEGQCWGVRRRSDMGKSNDKA